LVQVSDLNSLPFLGFLSIKDKRKEIKGSSQRLEVTALALVMRKRQD